MAKNLYIDDLSTLAYADVAALLALEAAADERPAESTRLDYKSDLTDLGETVTAFANTFGGVIVVGVTENDRKPVDARGVQRPRGELATNILNSILNTVHPMPQVAIGVTPSPEDGRLIAVVRVEAGDRPPYMWTRDGKNKIAVRLDGRCATAGPLELEGLISRRGNRSAVQGPFGEHGDSGFKPVIRESDGRTSEAESFLRLTIRPDRALRLILHRAVEQQIMKLLLGANNESIGIAPRDGYYFELLQQDSRPHRRWRFFADGGITYAVEVLTDGDVQLHTVANSIAHGVRVATSVLESCGWFGRVTAHTEFTIKRTPASLTASLSVLNTGPHALGGVGPVLNSASDLLPGFSHHTVELEHAELREAAPYLAAALHQHLRNLYRADVDLGALTASMQLVVDGLRTRVA